MNTIAPNPKRPWLSHPRIRKVIVPGVIAVILLLLWQAVVTAGKVPEYIFPSPLVTLNTLYEDWGL